MYRESFSIVVGFNYVINFIIVIRIEREREREKIWVGRRKVVMIFLKSLSLLLRGRDIVFNGIKMFLFLEVIFIYFYLGCN